MVAVGGLMRYGTDIADMYRRVVRATGILRNELYIGRLVWNRLRYTKDPSTGRRVSRINPREEWIFRDVGANELRDVGVVSSTRGPFATEDGHKGE